MRRGLSPPQQSPRRARDWPGRKQPGIPQVTPSHCMLTQLAWPWEQRHLQKEGHLSNTITRPDGHFPSSGWQWGCPASRAICCSRRGEACSEGQRQTPTLPASLFGDPRQSEKRQQQCLFSSDIFKEKQLPRNA